MRAGFILLDKPEGLTSAACLNRIKRTIEVQKIGHTGTLDPQATGLLICLVNRATRLADRIQGGMKRYTGKIRFGITSSTDDIWGTTLTTSDLRPSFQEIQNVVQTFVGTIQQIPPQVSAIKVEGVRAYEAARRGEEISLSSRSVEVREFLVEPFSVDEICFNVYCSKGTYIRSLARDMGAMIGCGAVISELRRTISEPFDVTNAVALDDVRESSILPWTVAFKGCKTMSVESSVARRLMKGDMRDLNMFERYIEKEESLILTDEEMGEAFALLDKSEGGLPTIMCI